MIGLAATLVFAVLQRIVALAGSGPPKALAVAFETALLWARSKLMLAWPEDSVTGALAEIR